MKKTIWFDMDGTLYDLYKIPGWLKALLDGDASIFNREGYARAHLTRIRSAIIALIAEGWEVGILTWAPKDISWGDDELDRVADAKYQWIMDTMPELADVRFACIPYGESKAQFVIDMGEAGDVNYLVDDNKEVRSDWRDHTGGNGTFKTINASRSYYRELEGLVM